MLSKYVSVCRAVFSMLCSFFRLLIILIISILMTELSAFISTVTQPLAVIRDISKKLNTVHNQMKLFYCLNCF